jgi:hypothetical protein
MRPRPPGRRLISTPSAGFASAPPSKVLSSHFPSRVTKTGTASYFLGSRAIMTLVAESTETSCSAERPPKSTAIRSLFATVAMQELSRTVVPSQDP